MKKNIYALILITSLFVISACSSNSESNFAKTLDGESLLTCTKKIEDSDFPSKDTMYIFYNDTKVTRVNTTNITESEPKFVDTSIEMIHDYFDVFNTLKGFSVTVSKIGKNKIQTNMTINFEEVDNKEVVEKIGYMLEDNDLYYNNNMSIEQFRSSHLEDYTCDN